MASLNISSVSKKFGTVRVLDDVNLQIASGEFVVFVGPSGCGKSTLLRMISGLEDITSGTISIDGEVVNEVEPAHRGAAMVFQSYALYPHMTTFENVSFGLRMARMARALVRERVAQAAGILQLRELLERRPAQLSGGQKQRVAIGRAIVREPRVFLFDEPLSNLDAELRVQMRAELMELHRRLGTTMIYVTHDQVEAMTLADTMVVMSGGHVQQAGRPLDLYDDPDNRFVAGFVGSPKMNFLPARVARSGGGSLKLSGVGGNGNLVLPWNGSAPEGTNVEAGIRPEHMWLVDDAESDVSGEVTFVEEHGSVTYAHLRLGDGTRIVVRSDRDRHSVGAMARARIDASRVLLFDEAERRMRTASAQDA